MEYTDNKLSVKVAEDKLDKNVAAGIGCYIVFVSNHDGKCIVEYAEVVLFHIFYFNTYVINLFEKAEY